MSAIEGNSSAAVPDSPTKDGPKRMGKGPAPMTVLVLVAGLLITGVLAFATATVNDRNESRLLQEQVDQAGTVVTGVLPSLLETPLASGAAIAMVTGGQFAPFSRVISPSVGSYGPFGYVALCGEQAGVPVVLGSVGTPSRATSDEGSAQCSFVHEPHVSPGLSVAGIVDQGSRVALWYASPGSASTQGLYAEYLLPPITIYRCPSRPHSRIWISLSTSGRTRRSKTCWKPPPPSCPSVAGMPRRRSRSPTRS
jgi:hypothetical protein